MTKQASDISIQVCCLFERRKEDAKLTVAGAAPASSE